LQREVEEAPVRDSDRHLERLHRGRVARAGEVAQERLGRRAVHPQERVLDREAAQRRRIAEHRQEVVDRVGLGMVGGLLGRLGSHLGAWIAEQIGDDGLPATEQREHAGASQTSAPFGSC